jgi:LPS-assembly protein
MPSWAGRLMLCAFLASGGAYSAESGDDCPPMGVSATAIPRLRAVRPAAPGPTFLWADSVQSSSNDVTELKGNAKIKRDGEQIEADYLRHDRATNRVDARGKVTLSQSDGTRFNTGEAQLNLDAHTGTASAGTYRLAGQGRGAMGGVEFLDEDHTRLSDMRFTTCPVGREDWAIRAGRLDIDTAEDVGVARNSTFELFGVPVLYLPYFRFPISDERKSGFLVPQFGYGSHLGAVPAAPYYWNIAPNYDATLTPRIMTERGIQMQTEFRYLGQSLDGRLEVEYLPNDSARGEPRAAGTYQHRQMFNPYWSAAVDLRGVSD